MKHVTVPGSCGELVQGLHEDHFFLVTCPINLYSTAQLTEAKWRNPHKIAKARRLTLEYLRKERWLNIKVQSQLLQGKGMASSSADIAATIQLVAWELNQPLTIDEIGEIASEIEPTDGIFCPGIVKYDYRNGLLLESFGEPPPLKILVFDGGGTINTVNFNRQDKLLKHYLAHERDIHKAYELVKEGLLTKDYAKIGSGATLSGYTNQNLLYKANFEDLIFISEKYNALGVNVAHSGTVMGVLFPPTGEQQQIQACLEEITATCPRLKFVKEVTMISGGIKMEE